MSEAGARRPGPLAMILMAVVAAGAVAAGLWAFAASHDRVEVVIPAGTSDMIAARKSLHVVGDPIRVDVGDTIVVRNEDDRMHTFDGTAIEPGATVEISEPAARDGMVAASFVNNGELRLIVK